MGGSEYTAFLWRRNDMRKSVKPSRREARRRATLGHYPYSRVFTEKSLLTEKSFLVTYVKEEEVINNPIAINKRNQQHDQYSKYREKTKPRPEKSEKKRKAKGNLNANSAYDPNFYYRSDMDGETCEKLNLKKEVTSDDASSPAMNYVKKKHTQMPFLINAQRKKESDRTHKDRSGSRWGVRSSTSLGSKDQTKLNSQRRHFELLNRTISLRNFFSKTDAEAQELTAEKFRNALNNTNNANSSTNRRTYSRSYLRRISFDLGEKPDPKNRRAILENLAQGRDTAETTSCSKRPRTSPSKRKGKLAFFLDQPESKSKTKTRKQNTEKIGAKLNWRCCSIM